jgi:hypothetical protein
MASFASGFASGMSGEGGGGSPMGGGQQQKKTSPQNPIQQNGQMATVQPQIPQAPGTKPNPYQGLIGALYDHFNPKPQGQTQAPQAQQGSPQQLTPQQTTGVLQGMPLPPPQQGQQSAQPPGGQQNTSSNLLMHILSALGLGQKGGS